ncbi:bifunctional glyoxylate/hydroxypyruvate reductase B [Gordoniibacillus kamchatkensis]|uniref:Bifunctional glyoxylate/hydroxypyruvate reductase B n=1 Tax=Gordoniibacillus kamchatkensis TaxID=1590651 RepID=A0ABR5A3E4_9BACL|nr:D-glycerate dehydrogenase [Paenibacillus sp. VKM B-2647]KIL35579.1 bifunctional glyoxylate/hydroxypyruvate reductase B [Paenibacillus sp. VKM B-2647]
MKPYVFIDRPVPAQVEQHIAEHCEYSVWDRRESIPADVLREKLAKADGLLTAGRKIDSRLLELAPNLKAVSTISVGYNHFDVAAMKARGVLGTNTPDVLTDTVADLVFGLILSTARRIPELDRYVKDGLWKRDDGENLFGVDVHHASLGIVGMGRIGEAVARRGKFGFSMSVGYCNRTRREAAERELGAVYMSMEELLRSSDFVVLMTPLTPETTRMFGREQFAMMKRGAIFINASRGQTVDEAALASALQEGTIYAAGLDVFEREPVAADNPLLGMPNVVTLPHIGSATARTRFDMAMLAARNLVLAVSGQTPPNLVPELRANGQG